MTKRRVYGFLFILILCFIWGNSMLTQETSGALSRFVAEFLGGGSDVGEQEHFLVRKMAHFIEYAALGAVTCLFFDSFVNDAYRKYTAASLVGVLTPLIDETIQIFSDRGPALSDVWLDMSGYVFGSLVVITVFFIVHRRAGRGNETG